MTQASPVTLLGLRPGSVAAVAAIDWDRLTLPEARRLRELGLDEGVEIELLRAPGWLGGPLACRIGRMTIALRKHVALAIRVGPHATLAAAE